MPSFRRASAVPFHGASLWPCSGVRVCVCVCACARADIRVQRCAGRARSSAVPLQPRSCARQGGQRFRRHRRRVSIRLGPCCLASRPRPRSRRAGREHRTRTCSLTPLCRPARVGSIVSGGVFGVVNVELRARFGYAPSMCACSGRCCLFLSSVSNTALYAVFEKKQSITRLFTFPYRVAWQVVSTALVPRATPPRRNTGIPGIPEYRAETPKPQLTTKGGGLTKTYATLRTSYQLKVLKGTGIKGL